MVTSTDTVEIARAMIKSGHAVEASALLQEFVDSRPAEWKPFVETPDRIIMHFWNEQEYQCYLHYFRGSGSNKRVIWARPSFTAALCLLGVIAVERKDWDAARRNLADGLRLEPDHPELLCETAFVLSAFNEHQAACETYVRAATIRAWATHAGSFRFSLYPTM